MIGLFSWEIQSHKDGLIWFPIFLKANIYKSRDRGQTTPQMLIRFRQDVIHLKPKVVVILAGINDIAGNTGPSTLEMIEDNLYSMTELALANGIQVVLCSVLPAYDFPWRPGQEPAEKVVELNRRIQSIVLLRVLYTVISFPRWQMKEMAYLQNSQRMACIPMLPGMQ